MKPGIKFLVRLVSAAAVGAACYELWLGREGAVIRLLIVAIWLDGVRR